MLSYRHAYHAGNHADVLKHLTLTLALDRLTHKASPLVYIDTHSGAGRYDLGDAQAQKTGEADAGIEALMAAPCDLPELNRYVQLVRRMRADQPRLYPGSPGVAAQLLRDQDRLLLMELHNTEVEALKANLGRDRRVAVHHRDGFEGLPALVPPTPPRGLVLMDPAYELSEDYARVLTSLERALQRWRTGVYLLWYPMLARQRDRSEWLKRQLRGLPAANLLVAELTVQAQGEDYGMHGSGMAIVNCPWQLDEQLAAVLPVLAGTLAGSGGGWHMEWLRART